MRASVPSEFSFCESARRGYSMEIVVTLALILTFSPGEKEQPWCVTGFAKMRSSKSSRANFIETENDSPSPGGEGRGEGERSI